LKKQEALKASSISISWAEAMNIFISGDGSADLSRLKLAKREMFDEAAKLLLRHRRQQQLLHQPTSLKRSDAHDVLLMAKIRNEIDDR